MPPVSTKCNSKVAKEGRGVHKESQRQKVVETSSYHVRTVNEVSRAIPAVEVAATADKAFAASVEARAIKEGMQVLSSKTQRLTCSRWKKDAL